MITTSINKRTRSFLIGIRPQNGLSKGTHRQNGLFVMLGESGLMSPSNSLPEAFPSHTCSQALEVEVDCTEYAVNKSSLILDSLITSLTNLVFVALDAGLKGFLDVNN